MPSFTQTAQRLIEQYDIDYARSRIEHDGKLVVYLLKRDITITVTPKTEIYRNSYFTQFNRTITCENTNYWHDTLYSDVSGEIESTGSLHKWLINRRDGHITATRERITLELNDIIE